MRNVSKNVLCLIFIFSAVTCFSGEETILTMQKVDEIITSPSDDLYNITDIDFRGLSKLERKLHLVISRERLEFLQAKERFRDCLFKSDPESARDVFNCPMQCKDLVHALSMCDSQDEAIEMIEKFDRLWKKYD